MWRRDHGAVADVCLLPGSSANAWAGIEIETEPTGAAPSQCATCLGHVSAARQRSAVDRSLMCSACASIDAAAAEAQTRRRRRLDSEPTRCGRGCCWGLRSLLEDATPADIWHAPRCPSWDASAQVLLKRRISWRPHHLLCTRRRQMRPRICCYDRYGNR